MKNIIDYIKDKIYYILGATIIIIVVLLLVSSCSGKSKSYSSIENDMVSAAKNYYANHKSNLPKEEGNSIKVTIGTLIDYELLEEVKDPNNKNQTCSGYVEVTKVGDEYAYTPFLTCKGNYEPEYLVDKIKNSKLDEYGNGVYEMDGEYVYRGDDVNNYLKFNNQVWRIMRVNSNNEIKIILDQYTEDEYTWETSYNITQEDTVGITDDYLNTNIRKELLEYYNSSFSTEEKKLIVLKDWCIGSLNIEEDFNKAKECSKIKENEYVGLINLSDYKDATLDKTCTKPNQEQCNNRNYLTKTAKIFSWTMNTVEGNNYQVLCFFNGKIIKYDASDKNSISPVVYLASNTIIKSGYGTEESPYIIK